MIRNITLSADEMLIENARKHAQKEKRSLNDLFRKWLNRYVMQNSELVNYDSVMKKLKYANPGKKITREEMNAR